MQCVPIFTTKWRERAASFGYAALLLPSDSDAVTDCCDIAKWIGNRLSLESLPDRVHCSVWHTRLWTVWASLVGLFTSRSAREFEKSFRKFSEDCHRKGIIWEASSVNAHRTLLGLINFRLLESLRLAWVMQRCLKWLPFVEKFPLGSFNFWGSLLRTL